MIRYGNRLTLSEVDIRRWTRITGFEPTAIATVADLEDYVRECKRYYAEPSDDSAFLNWLMDVELERYGGEPAGNRPVRLAVACPDPDRADAEHELLWNIALDGDVARRCELIRLLDGQPGGSSAPNVSPGSAEPDGSI